MDDLFDKWDIQWPESLGVPILSQADTHSEENPNTPEESIVYLAVH